MVRGVGVKIEAWGASHVYCGLVQKYSMVEVCIILEQENGRASDTKYLEASLPGIPNSSVFSEWPSSILLFNSFYDRSTLAPLIYGKWFEG